MRQKVLIWVPLTVFAGLSSYFASFWVFWKAHTVSLYTDFLTSQILISSNAMDRLMEKVYAPLLDHSRFTDRIWYDNGRGCPLKKAPWVARTVIMPTPASANTPNAAATGDLMKAVARGDVAGVRSAIDRGALVWVTYPRRNTLMHRNAAQGNIEISKILVGQGLSVMARNADGLDPVRIAIRSGHLDLAAYLASTVTKATNQP